jgi:integrase
MKRPGTFPALLEAYFVDRLMRQRQVSRHTLASYRDTFRLMLEHAQRQMGKAPSALTLADLDAPFLGSFLDHLEKDRGNSARSRNVRLAAIHSFFRYVALHAPEHSALASRVLAMPSKRYLRRPIDFLTPTEVTSLLAAPNLGRPDYAHQSCSTCVATTSPLALSPSFVAKEKDGNCVVRRFARTQSPSYARGSSSGAASLRIPRSRPSME